SPKEIDYLVTRGTAKGTTQKAIYKLDGGKFTECRAPANQDKRPAEFRSTKENGFTLITYKRLTEAEATALATARAVEDRAVKSVEGLGGKVTRNINIGGAVTGVDYFLSKVTDDDLKGLADFKRLTTVRLTGTKVTDAGLVHLAPLAGLTHLNLDRTRV